MRLEKAKEMQVNTSKLSLSYQLRLHIIVHEAGPLKDETILPSISNDKSRLSRYAKEFISIESATVKGHRKLPRRISRVEIVKKYWCDCLQVFLKVQKKKVEIFTELDYIELKAKRTYAELAVREFDRSWTCQPHIMLGAVSKGDALKLNVIKGLVRTETKVGRAVDLDVTSKDHAVVLPFAVVSALDFHVRS